MGKLREKLRRAIRAEPPRPLGFGRVPADAVRVPPVVLIGHLDAWDPNLVGHLKAAGIDTLILPGSNQPPEAEVLAGLTWGVELGGNLNAELLSRYFEAGADFVLLEPEAPAELLSPDGGRYLRLTPDFPNGLLRSLDLLPVEGFCLRAPAAGEALTVSDLLVFLKFAAVSRKPILYELGRLPTQTELPVLRDAGVVGLVVPATFANLEALGDLREAVDKLPRRRAVGTEQPVVTVPPPSVPTPTPTAPAPEPDEDDEE